MKAYSSLASFACALVIGGTLPIGIALGGHPETPAYQAGAGVLSYSFFNLSGQSCTFTPYGAQPNPYSAQGDSNWGWQNTGSNLAFFNNGNPEGNGGWIFYNNSDPINTDTSSNPPAFPLPISLNNGTGSGSGNATSTFIQVTSTETGQNWSINYPAMGDSWGVDCGNGNSTSAIATLASSGSSLQSGWYGSLVGSIPNSNITPTGYSNPFNDGCSANNLNPCGADFASQGLNWNLNSNNLVFQPMGGLWTGINYSYPFPPAASNVLNFAILPINFSAYVQAYTGINFTDMTPNVQTYYTPIYGGHTAIAVGDPYLVSSISAKILWFLATSDSFTLNNGTKVSNVANTLSNGVGSDGGSGVFWSNSYEDAYVQWFVGSQSSSANFPGQPLAAATAYHSAYQAASVPIDKESVWGKVFSGLADTAIKLTTSAIAKAAESEEIPAVGAIAEAVGGAIEPEVNSAITNAYTYSASGAPPNPTQAPMTYNGTFAATNLFGLLLSNMGVQSEINAVNNITGGPSPLWSNYDISVDSECSGIGVTNNLMQGTCNGVVNGSKSSLPEGSYTNVYASVQTTTKLSIWNAILSGSNIATNSSGYMVTGGSNQYPAFSPPTVVVNASTSNFSPNSIVVNTAFNANTGFLTANSIGVASEPLGAQSTASTTEPSYIPPSALQTNTTGTSPVIWSISFPNDGDISYTSTGANAGAYTINQYCITNASDTIGNTNPTPTTCTTPANGAQTINMTNCLPDSLVVVGDSIADSSQTPPTVNITLACQPPPTPLTNVTLNYSNCTNDKWASGGVYAAVTTPPDATGTVGEVILACACVPSYLDGPEASNAPQANLLGGYVVGATSSAPGQQCPKPAT